MVFVLILMLVISLIGATLVRATIAQHRQRQRDEVRAQTVRLAEAGWGKAVRALARDPAYSGEVWRVGNDVLGADRTAEIRLEIAQSPRDAKRMLRVVADYPVDSPWRTRYTLEGTVAVQEFSGQ
jgi:hypothetical protein